MAKRACDNCGYETECKPYTGGWPIATHHFCEVCANTPLSKATQFPRTDEDPNIYKSLGWIANRLLDELRRKD